MPAWIQHAFFVSLYLRLLLTHEELSFCSRSLVTLSVTATIEVLVLVVFLVFALVLEVLAVDFMSSLRPAHIACELGKFLRKLLLRIYDRPLPISLSNRSHPALVEALRATFSQKRCPSIGFIFPCRTSAHRQRQACLVDHHCLRSGDIGQLTKCTKPLPWSAILSWSSFVLLLKRHTGSDTEHHGARAKRRNSSITVHISIDTGAPFFF